MADGLYRWNEDRTLAAITAEDEHKSYRGLLRQTSNELVLQVLARKISASYTEPRKYTGKSVILKLISSSTLYCT